MKAMMGRKVGMTQVFDENGIVVPVTVVNVESNQIVQIKSDEKEGYTSIQVGFDDVKEKRINKPLKGHFEKSEVSPKRVLQEFRVENTSEYTAGQELKADLFNEGLKIDITGTSKGKGFQGVIKRHNQSRGPETHGSRYHRRPGSMGASAYPARVFKGKNLPGHMGHETVTVKNLEIVKIDAEKNIVLVKGAVPGPKNGLLTLKESANQGK